MDALICAENVTVEFGELVAVCDVSLTLGSGDLLGLIGPNGAGKTTLLRVLCGLQAPTVGRARIMGFDVFEQSDDVRRHIGFSPDSPPAYEELTVDQFLRFIAQAYDIPPPEVGSRIEFWLEQLWLSEKREQKIKTLSRGIRQRVTVARTLLPNPNAVLLDEPSSGLDPAGRIQFRRVLASLRDQGKALIVSSHILADLEEYCTHIAIIEHGRILRFGRVRELHGRLANRHRYRMVLAGGTTDRSADLAATDGVSQVTRKEAAYVFEYDDSPAAAAELLRTLIQHGLPVAEFARFDETLEETYLRAGVRQVD